MKHKIKKKIWVTIFFILVVIFGFLYTGIYQKQVTLFKKKVILESSSIIDNYAKIIVTPYPVIDHEPIKFNIEIESFQNQDLLSIDLKETALLADKNNILYAPNKWIVIKRDNYRIKGDLVFPPLENTFEEISLNLFQIDENKYIWKLKNNK